MIRTILQAHARSQPNKIALHSTTDERLSYAALLRYVDSFSYHLPKGAGFPVNTEEKKESGSLVFTSVQSDNILETLLVLVKDVFKLSDINSHHNFFELGGDSILGMQLIARINASFSIHLTIRELYNHPVFNALNRIIAQSVPLNEDSHFSLLKPLTIRPEKAELSSVQKTVWFVSHLSGTQSLYHMTWSYRLQGDLSLEALQWSMEQLMCQHDVLRTRIKNIDGNPYQYLSSDAEDQISLKIRTLSDISEIQSVINTLIKTPFNLKSERLFQPYLFQLNHQDNVLCFHLHHLIADLWSKQVLQKELSFYYNAYLNNKSAFEIANTQRINYIDYVYWFRTWQTESWLKQEITFWKNYLSDAPPLLNLPMDYARPNETCYECAEVPIELSRALTLKLQHFATAQKMSLYMVLLTVFKVLLQHYSGETKIVVGTPIANRVAPALENMMGLFANTLVMATNIPEASDWQEAFALVRESTLEAFQHTFCPFETLIKAINPERNLNYHPIFQVMFNFVSVPQNDLAFSEIASTEMPMTYLMSAFDMHVSLSPVNNKIQGAFYYNKVLFKPETIQRWVKHYEKLLDLAIDSLRLPIGKSDFLLSEEKLLLNQWTATDKNYPDNETTIGRFEKVAVEHPNDIALLCGHQEITYAELNAKANDVGKMLVHQGVKSGDLMAILIERSIDMVIGLLGIWKAGAGYVPFNLDDPIHRIAYVLQETQCQFILTKQCFSEKIKVADFSGKIITLDNNNRLNAGEISIGAGPVPARGEDIAYVLYTSGSTGKPKGVMVEHRSLWEYLWACHDWAKFPAQNRFLQLAPYTFDASLFDLYLPLISRVTVVLPETENNYDLAYLAHLIVDKKINYLKSVPSFLRLLTHELKTKSCDSLLNIYSVGEELLVSDVQRFHRNTGAKIVNQYGPTESVGLVSLALCSPDEATVTLGRPISNIRLYVLNAQLQHVPLGCYGELYIAKRYLARGYLGQEALTAQRFIPNPFMKPEEKALGHYRYLYRSGDKVCWLPDGQLEFSGRIDFQVKINGKRVELGEIEAVITTHDAIQAVAVIKVSEQLVAFVVFNEVIDLKTLRTHAEKYLPAFMIPTRWIILNELPVTQTGKIDRKVLPSLMDSTVVYESDLESTHVIPPDFMYLYDHIIDLLKNLLPHSDKQLLMLNPDKNFFELGLDSLRLIAFTQALREQLHVNLGVEHLFRHQTLSKLTQYIFALFQDNESTLFQTTRDSFLISFGKTGTQSPLFLIPGGWGETNEMLIFLLMMSDCDLNRPIYGIRSRATDSEWKMPSTLREQAQAVFKEIQKIQPHGPYYFLGECIASTMALELIQLAEQQGELPGVVILLDSRPFFRQTFPFSRYLNLFSVQLQEKMRRKKRHATLNLPPYLRQYYHLLTLWKPFRMKSQLHLILSLSMEKPQQILKRWKLFFKKEPLLYQVTATHRTYIRQESEETVSIIQNILSE